MYFTATRFQGNQLAVFEDAGESERRRNAEARQRDEPLRDDLHHSTRPATERAKGVRVRIFTTQEELPFAGHPTLGTACTIRSFFPEYAGAEEIVLDLNVGKIRVVRVLTLTATKATRQYGVMTQAKPTFGALHEPARRRRRWDCQ